MQTQSVENYLKTVYAVQRKHGRAETSVLAERLGVASSSVTKMLKKLAREQLVAYSPYKGVVLTDAGQRAALQIIRRHRLIELYLVKELGVPWDEVHAEADKWEHVLSKQLEERIDSRLGYPSFDPHGSFIPTECGQLLESNRARLTDLMSDQIGVVAELSDDCPTTLRYLGELGLYPGTVIRITANVPQNDMVHIKLGDVEQQVSRQVAYSIWVCPMI